MKYISLVSILILYSIAQGLTPSAQKILHGTVRDAQSGKPLPAANVQVIGKMRGTIANADGSYRLDIEQWPAAISASYIGYRSDTLHISSGTPEVLDIQLEPTLIHLEDLTITAENPAVAIMRRVIAGKRALRRQITSFRADAYSRLNAQNDTAIVLIMESQSHLYWQREKGTREVVLSRQQTENLRGIAASIGAGDIPNFYDDDINLAGYAFIGPTHPDALDFYEFELINRRAMDGEIVYDIALQPKTKLQPAFTGQLSVLDKKFVLLEVDVEDSGALPPQSFLQEIHLQCRQQFRLFGDGYWLPVDWHETGALRIGMTGLQFPTIKYVRLSSLDNYAVNIALPDSIFSDDRPRRVVAQVHTADSLLTLAHRTVPLTLEETLAYKKIDSTRTIDQYFKPSGFLAKFAKISVQVDDREITAGVGSSKKIAVSGSPQVWYNRVEGLHAGLIGSIKISQLTLLPKVAYLTAAKDWATGMECSYAIGKSRWANLSLHYHDAVLPVTEPSLYPQLITSIPVLLAERDYYDYYRSKSAAARLTLRSAEHHLRATIGLSREKHSSLEKHTDFDLLGENAPQRRNPAIADGVLSSARLQLIWGETVMTGVVGGTGLQVRAEGGFKGLWDGEFEYARYNVILNGRLRTFLRRRLISPCLDVRLLAGGHTGELPPQRLMAMDGFLSVYSPFGGFRTLRNRPVYSGNYAALFWEHSFRTWPFEITGLKFLTKQGYNLILHGAHGKSWDDAQDHPGWPVGFATKQQQHHEIGLSLSGLLSYFRLDVTKSLSGNHDLYWGIGLAKIF